MTENNARTQGQRSTVSTKRQNMFWLGRFLSLNFHYEFYLLWVKQMQIRWKFASRVDYSFEFIPNNINSLYNGNCTIHSQNFKSTYFSTFQLNLEIPTLFLNWKPKQHFFSFWWPCIIQCVPWHDLFFFFHSLGTPLFVAAFFFFLLRFIEKRLTSSLGHFKKETA